MCRSGGLGISDVECSSSVIGRFLNKQTRKSHHLLSLVVYGGLRYLAIIGYCQGIILFFTFSNARLKKTYVLDSLLINGYQEMLIYFVRFTTRSVLFSIARYFNAIMFDYK